MVEGLVLGVGSVVLLLPAASPLPGTAPVELPVVVDVASRACGSQGALGIAGKGSPCRWWSASMISACVGPLQGSSVSSPGRCSVGVCSVGVVSVGLVEGEASELPSLVVDNPAKEEGPGT